MIKKKYLFKSIAIIFIIIFFALGVIMIYRNSQVSKFYTINEAYRLGYLTFNDLSQIAFYNNNASEQEKLKPLDIKKEKAIKISYLKRINMSSLKSLKGIHIVNYYGVYGKCTVVGLMDDYRMIDVLVIEEHIIDGIIFKNFKVPGGPIVWIEGEK